MRIHRNLNVLESRLSFLGELLSLLEVVWWEEEEYAIGDLCQGQLAKSLTSFKWPWVGWLDHKVSGYRVSCTFPPFGPRPSLSGEGQAAKVNRVESWVKSPWGAPDLQPGQGSSCQQRIRTTGRKKDFLKFREPGVGLKSKRDVMQSKSRLPG